MRLFKITANSCIYAKIRFYFCQTILLIHYFLMIYAKKRGPQFIAQIQLRLTSNHLANCLTSTWSHERAAGLLQRFIDYFYWLPPIFLLIAPIIKEGIFRSNPHQTHIKPTLNHKKVVCCVRKLVLIWVGLLSKVCLTAATQKEAIQDA